MALIEITEEIFSSHPIAEPTHMEESSLEASREMTTSPKDKVVEITKVYGPLSKKENPNMIILWVWYCQANVTS